MKPQALASTVVEAAENKKAYDITVLDIGNVSIMADYFVLINGRSTTHVQSIASEIEKKLYERGLSPRSKEGYNQGRWILLDYGDVVVHIFEESERKFYNLERLWGDTEVTGFRVNG
ncbi:MAG: ribosome silencing factor [Clostridiales bacterium]|nr:ribosome silencing factor [Clostridiales bacterium]MCF8022986.1 ribosome silencing factor [Clostridiales bacterium]